MRIFEKKVVYTHIYIYIQYARIRYLLYEVIHVSGLAQGPWPFSENSSRLATWLDATGSAHEPSKNSRSFNHL